MINEHEVIELLQSIKGRSLSAYRIGKHFHTTAKQISQMLNDMVDKGLIESCVPNRAREYLIRVAVLPSSFPQGYRPEFKPLTGYDIGAHQRMSEGARNPATGVV